MINYKVSNLLSSMSEDKPQLIAASSTIACGFIDAFCKELIRSLEMEEDHKAYISNPSITINEMLSLSLVCNDAKIVDNLTEYYVAGKDINKLLENVVNKTHEAVLGLMTPEYKELYSDQVIPTAAFNNGRISLTLSYKELTKEKKED